MRITLIILLFASSLFAGMKVYDTLEEAPKSAHLYMMIDGGSFVDISGLPSSYQVRFSKNPDAYVKVEKENGEWATPKVQPRKDESFEQLEYEPDPHPKPQKRTITIAQRRPEPNHSRPQPQKEVEPDPIQNEPLIVEKNLLISEFKNTMRKAINKVIKEAKAGRAEGIVEGSLEDVEHYTKIARIARRDFNFDGVDIKDYSIKRSISSYERDLKSEKRKLDRDLEDIKVSLVKKDMIPQAKEVDEIINTPGHKLVYPNAIIKKEEDDPNVNLVRDRREEAQPRQQRQWGAWKDHRTQRRIQMMEERLQRMPRSSPMYERMKRNLKMLKSRQ